MSFVSGAFLGLVAACCALYYLLPARCQNAVLLAASACFAAAAGRWTVGVLAAEILLTWLAGRLLARCRGGARRAALTAGILLLLGMLAAFKYADILAGRATALGRLPVLGISFYTLMAIGYLVDVAQDAVPAQRSLLRFALFLGFFPQLSSGPIGRAGELLPQFAAPRAFCYDTFARGLTRVLWGYFLKLVMADSLALAVDPVFRTPAAFSGPALVLATVLFSAQLYLDFAGYSDIARGLGEMFGITLRANFDHPFAATNFSGFWSRWHISLSSWFQDYLFLPLAWADAERLTAGRWRRLPAELCVFVVFFVSGIWHGSTWPFVAWGLWQAACRVGEELLHRCLGKPRRHPAPWLRAGKRLAVFALWCGGMVLFRLGQQSDATLADCAAFYARCAADWAVLASPARLLPQLRAMNLGRKFLGYMLPAALLRAGVERGALRAGTDAAAWLRARRPAVRMALYYLLALLVLCFGQLGSSTFIYFQF